MLIIFVASVVVKTCEDDAFVRRIRINFLVVEVLNLGQCHLAISWYVCQLNVADIKIYMESINDDYKLTITKI